MNIFNSIQKWFDNEGQQILQPFTTPKNIDQEIHNAVFSSQDELLKEANNILDKIQTDEQLGKPKYPKDKIELLEKLEKLGFTNQQDVKKLREEIKTYQENLSAYNERQDNAKNQAELISYYSKKYPKNKFITKDCIKSICNRFGLLFAPSEMYKAEIPEQNMKEIAEFRVSKEDAYHNCTVVYEYGGWTKGRKREVTEEISLPMRFAGFSFNNTNNWMISPIPRSLKSKQMIEEEEREEILKIELETHISLIVGERVRVLSFSSSIFRNSDIEDYQGELISPMMIAPKHKFEIKEGYKVQEGFEVGFKKVVEIKDPVVLQPVGGGYLIVSAWGFENTLPEINGNTNAKITDSSN